MKLGEASGGADNSALVTHNKMATFTEAGVSLVMRGKKINMLRFFATASNTNTN